MQSAGHAEPTRPSDGLRVARTAAIVLALLVIAFATLAAIDVLGRRTRRASATYPAAATIEVRVGSGDVRLYGSDRGDVLVDRTEAYTWRAPRPAQALEGGVLRLDGRCPGPVLFGGCDVDFRIELPAGTRVKVRTGSGDVIASGLRAGAELRTGSGDVRARDLAGGLVADTGSGDVVAERVAGPLVARSGSGDMLVDGLSATTVEVSTSSGNVTVAQTVSPERLRVDSGSGDVRVTVPDEVYRVDARSGTGDVNVAVRQDPDAERLLQVTTRSGDVRVARG
jgi:hypothetical protein